MPPRKKAPEPSTPAADLTPAEEPEQAREEEVRSEEFTQGIENPVWRSQLPPNVVEELRQPLDPNRIRRRQGRGSTQFEYLAGHDVKRRANELFGFGNWGYRVIELTLEEAIPVLGNNDKEGWHVAYKAIVETTVRDCLPMSDVGYGDGVEYGPAAKATARELATKEAVTDALKRSLTGWGDQFGLILYAKADEKQRINRDQNIAGTTGEVRRESGARQEIPRTWAEINALAAPYGPTLGWAEWSAEAAFALYAKADSARLTQQEKNAIRQKAAGAILALRDACDPDLFPPFTRKDVQAAWAKVLNGTVLAGPAWRMSPDEQDRPPHESTAAPAEGTESASEGTAGPDAGAGSPEDVPPVTLTPEEQAAADQIEFGVAAAESYFDPLAEANRDAVDISDSSSNPYSREQLAGEEEAKP